MPQNQFTFNAEAYLAANPDVAQNWQDTPYQHYLQYGKKEGRNASFDVAPEFGDDPTSLMKDLENQWFSNYKNNMGGANPAIQQQLNELKEYNPEEFYSGMLSNLGKTYGWQIGQNTNAERGPAIQAQIQSLIPEAKAAGLTDAEISDILSKNVSEATRENQQRIVNEQQSGNFWKENLLGAGKVGALALGAYGLDNALNAGLAGAELAGPTYGELGITGVEGGFAGPTYAELGYTGLNQGEAIAAADAASKLASLKEGLSTAKDVATNANRARKLASLLQGVTGGASKAMLGSQLANALTVPQEQFGGLYRMNQNPFAQTQQAKSIQTPFGKQQDFLSQLAEESKPEPTLADLLRNA